MNETTLVFAFLFVACLYAGIHWLALTFFAVTVVMLVVDLRAPPNVVVAEKGAAKGASEAVQQQPIIIIQEPGLSFSDVMTATMMGQIQAETILGEPSGTFNTSAKRMEAKMDQLVKNTKKDEKKDKDEKKK